MKHIFIAIQVFQSLKQIGVFKLSFVKFDYFFVLTLVSSLSNKVPIKGLGIVIRAEIPSLRIAQNT